MEVLEYAFIFTLGPLLILVLIDLFFAGRELIQFIKEEKIKK